MKLTIDRLSGDRVRLTFEAEGGVTYTLLATDALGQARHRFFKLVSPVKP